MQIMKKILVVVGAGHKKGNTDQLADAFIKGAEEAGNHVTKVFLGGKDIRPCIGCNGCMRVGKCIQKDDMQSIYEMYNESDMIVLASPLYFWQISGLLKTFIDRLFGAGGSYDKPMDSALLMTCRQPAAASYDYAKEYYLYLARYNGWNHIGMVLAGDCGGLLEGG